MSNIKDIYKNHKNVTIKLKTGMGEPKEGDLVLSELAWDNYNGNMYIGRGYNTFEKLIDIEVAKRLKVESNKLEVLGDAKLKNTFVENLNVENDIKTNNLNVENDLTTKNLTVTESFNFNLENVDIKNLNILENFTLPEDFVFEQDLEVNNLKINGLLTTSSDLKIKDLILDNLTVNENFVFRGGLTLNDLTLNNLRINETFSFDGEIDCGEM